MHKWNLLKKTAPCILSLAVAATSFPTAVMATDLDSSIVADKTEQSDEEEIAEVSVTRQLRERLLMQRDCGTGPER